MTPALLNLSIVQGVDFGPVVITCLDSSGVAVDITGWTAYAEARKTPCDVKAFDLSPTIPTGTDGKISISKTRVQAAAICQGLYGWDLLLQNAAGVRSGPFVAGRIAVTKPTSQPTP